VTLFFSKREDESPTYGEAVLQETGGGVGRAYWKAVASKANEPKQRTSVVREIEGEKNG